MVVLVPRSVRVFAAMNVDVQVEVDADVQRVLGSRSSRAHRIPDGVVVVCERGTALVARSFGCRAVGRGEEGCTIRVVGLDRPRRRGRVPAVASRGAKVIPPPLAGVSGLASHVDS